jgi:hypothetical protein
MRAHFIRHLLAETGAPAPLATLPATPWPLRMSPYPMDLQWLIIPEKETPPAACLSMNIVLMQGGIREPGTNRQRIRHVQGVWEAILGIAFHLGSP